MDLAQGSLRAAAGFVRVRVFNRSQRHTALLAPILYCASQVRLPPALKRSPNPGRSSSKTMASDLPAGKDSLATFAFVSRMG